MKIITKLLPIAAILVLATSCYAKGGVKSIIPNQKGRSIVPAQHSNVMHARAGDAYKSSFNAALMSAVVSNDCPDLTEEEIEEAQNMPGGGYTDGQWAGENPDECLGLQQVWDDGETIFILDDDGEIIELAML